MNTESSDNDDYQDDYNDEDFDISKYEKYSEDSDENNLNEDEGCQEKTENESEYVGPILPGGHRFDKKYVCIRYPGNVKNPEKAVETLGGIGEISTAVDTSNRRLELRFRPSDGYCKPACGDRHQVSAFLLRVRTKKSRGQSVNEASLKKLIEGYRGHEPLESHNPDNLAVEKSIKELEERIKNCSVDPEEKSHETSFNDEEKKSQKSNSTSTFWKKTSNDPLSTLDKGKYENLSKDENYQLPKIKVIARVDTEFRFTNLCDFQYLPVTKNMQDSKKVECIYEKIYPIGIPSEKWIQDKVPYFLPPAVFSRMDSVQSYSLKTETKETGLENVIGKTRKRRAGFSNVIQFNTDILPSGPPKGIETAMIVKFLSKSHQQAMKELFDERPIWSKNALVYKTNFTGEQLRILLPSVAYYFMTGPWRIMWVKLGYDPRKDPTARKYQTLDYRLKHMHGLEQNVKGKRTYTNYILPYKSAPVAKPRTAVLTNMREEQEAQKSKKLNEDSYVYREGMIPPSRQMFYQYCDVLSDEIQEMFAKLPDPLPGTKCHEKRGWLPSGFSDQCREIINKQVLAAFRKEMNIPEDHPTTLPHKRKLGINLRFSQSGRAAKRRKLIDQRIAEKLKKKSDDDSDKDWEDL